MFTMKELVLSKKKKKRIEEIRERWLKEAEPYLENTAEKKVMQVEHPHLDGHDSVSLSQIQMKYQKEIREVMESPE